MSVLKERGQIQRGCVAMETLDPGDHKTLQTGHAPASVKRRGTRLCREGWRSAVHISAELRHVTSASAHYSDSVQREKAEACHRAKIGNIGAGPKNCPMEAWEEGFSNTVQSWPGGVIGVISNQDP